MGIDGETLAKFIADLAAQDETVEETAVLLSQRENPETCFKGINDRSMPVFFMGSVKTGRALTR